MEAVTKVEKQENPLERVAMTELNLKHLWLFRYSLPCHRGNMKIFQERLESGNFKPLNHINESECFQGDFSRYVVRDYFMGLHNALAFQAAQWDPKMFFHMLIPYKINFIQTWGNEIDVRGRVLKSFLENYEEFPRKLQSVKLSKRQRKRVRDFDIANPSLLRDDEIIYAHAGWIVDVDKNEEQYEKPDSNIWKSFC